MNDLAEKALHAIDIARRELAARPVIGLAIGGCVVSAVLVISAGRIGAAPAAVPINHWLGLLPAAGYRVTDVWMGVVMLSATGALISLWLLTLHVARVRQLRERAVWMIAAAWAAPFAIGPPMLSTDVYRYVAQGLLERHGRNAYHHGPDALGSARLVDAIDPSWRSAHSTDAPLVVLASHLSASVTGGSVISAVIVLRVIEVLSVIVIGRLAADLAGPRRAIAMCLTVLNPAVLLYIVSAAHFTGVFAALLLASLLAASQRRWTRAVIFACLAAGVQPVTLLAVPPVIAVHVLGYPSRLKLRAALRDCAIAVVTLAVVVLSVPYGLGWTANLSSVMHVHIPFAPATGVGNVVGLIVPSASYDDLAAGGRIAAAAAGLTVIGYLYLTVRSRPLERTIGFGLLAAGILAPVVYPTYLLWGVLCLAPTALGARRDWVCALSCAACVLTPVGLGVRGGQYATGIGLALIGAVLIARLSARHREAATVPADLSGSSRR
jgi:hypothetical protein